MENFNIFERARYGHVTRDEILDALAELIAWREMADSVEGHVDGPEEFGVYISDLEDKAGICNNEDHSNFDDYKEFFDDCVGMLPKAWPRAEPWDLNLRAVITEAIEKGSCDEN